jgi:hypothetical protein
MIGKRTREGYVEIDCRDGVGITPEQAAQAGCNTLAVATGEVFKSATITCSHCERIVILNPDRTRSRGYCPKCDAYVCDDCEAVRVASGGACKPFKQVIDEFVDDAAKGRPPTSLVIPGRS